MVHGSWYLVGTSTCLSFYLVNAYEMIIYRVFGKHQLKLQLWHVLLLCSLRFNLNFGVPNVHFYAFHIISHIILASPHVLDKFPRIFLIWHIIPLLHHALFSPFPFSQFPFPLPRSGANYPYFACRMDYMKQKLLCASMQPCLKIDC